MRQTTATITWIASPNFGTFLQAFALQQVVLGLGYDNVIVDDSKVIESKRKITLRMKLGRVKNNLLEFLHLRSPQSPDESLQLYNDFKKKYLMIDTEWKNYEDLSNKYDIYICGSDQIWSPYLNFDPYYYLGFTNRKKIAYAPSTGTRFCTEDYQQNTKVLLESFDSISVREEDGADMLRSFVDKNISVVLDPTLLLTKNDYDKISSTCNVDEPYILCYFLTPNRWYLDYVKQYAQKSGLKLKIFNTNPIYQSMGFESICAGPSEFISFIKGANIIFTDSFHSSIFSIIYHKDFITFKRFIDGGNNDQNARIANLFKKLDITERFIGNNQLDTIETLTPIEFSIVEQRLTELRKTSINYLENALRSKNG